MKRPKFTDEHRYPNGYKPSCDTDIRKTFAKLTANRQEAAIKVKPIIRIKRTA